MRDCEDWGAGESYFMHQGKTVLPPQHHESSQIPQSHLVVEITVLADGTYSRIERDVKADAVEVTADPLPQDLQQLIDFGRPAGGQFAPTRTLFLDDGMAKSKLTP